MTVSGLGTSHTPFPGPAPFSSPAPATPVERVAGTDQSRSGFDQLTEADRSLIEHVTGQHIGPGFDPSAEPPSLFAATIAGERAAGRLAPGQEVTAVYLKDLDRRYQRTTRNPIGPSLDRAVGHLRGNRHFDVSA
jgi:hypothetical protein